MHRESDVGSGLAVQGAGGDVTRTARRLLDRDEGEDCERGQVAAGALHGGGGVADLQPLRTPAAVGVPSALVPLVNGGWGQGLRRHKGDGDGLWQLLGGVGAWGER